MKSSPLAVRLFCAVVLLAVAAYFVLNLSAYWMDPYKTTVAYN